MPLFCQIAYPCLLNSVPRFFGFIRWNAWRSVATVVAVGVAVAVVAVIIAVSAIIIAVSAIIITVSAIVVVVATVIVAVSAIIVTISVVAVVSVVPLGPVTTIVSSVGVVISSVVVVAAAIVAPLAAVVRWIASVCAFQPTLFLRVHVYVTVVLSPFRVFVCEFFIFRSPANTGIKLSGCPRRVTDVRDVFLTYSIGYSSAFSLLRRQ